MLGMVDMRDNVAAAGVVLLVGIAALFALRFKRKSDKGTWILVAAAFLGAPILAVMLWALYLLTSGECIASEERFEDLGKFLAIGAIGGTATAFGVTISAVLHRLIPRKRREQRP